MADPCRIRPALQADVAALGRIERACFSDPWSDQSLAESIGSGQGISLAAADRSGTIGYLLARHAGGSGEILNLAVAPEARRRGVGQALLEEILVLLEGARVQEVFLEVRESNAAALALYQGKGFRIAGSRRAYYRSPEEDALVLRVELGLSG